MSITYDDIRDRIGHKLGYGLTSTAWGANTTKSALIERCLMDGLRNFFDPPVLPGEREKHMWSFLTPTLTIDLVSGKQAYDLPANFVAFMSPLIFAPGTNDWFAPLPIRGAEEVQRRLGESDDVGRPMIAGVRVKPAHDIHVTTWELVVHPIPDGSYQVKAAVKINPTIPGADTDVPFGGQPHEKTLIEACLAEVEVFDDLNPSREHNERFIECLKASISHDRQVSAPHTTGYMGDPGSQDWRDNPITMPTIPYVTYNGATG
jgi:hypothetical protein